MPSAFAYFGPTDGSPVYMDDCILTLRWSSTWKNYLTLLNSSKTCSLYIIFFAKSILQQQSLTLILSDNTLWTPKSKLLRAHPICQRHSVEGLVGY